MARLQKAIDQHEKILIYGDYDVDGTTGTAVLLRALNYWERVLVSMFRIVSLKDMAFSNPRWRKP